MDHQKIATFMKGLTVSFVVELTSMVLFIVVAGSSQARIPSSIALAFLLLGVVAAVAFYIYLGRLASDLGKSWIVWVGLTIITNPIGSFVAYFMMRNNVKSLGELAPSR